MLSNSPPNLFLNRYFVLSSSLLSSSVYPQRSRDAIKNFDVRYDSASPRPFFVGSLIFSFVSSLRLSPLSIPYHWLNARRDERGPNVAFPEDRALPPSFTRFSSPCKRSTVPLLSSLNPFVRSSCTRTHTPHLPLILSFDPHRTFPRKFSSISRVGYILFRSTSRAPVLCPCFSLPPVPTPVHPCFSQRSSRFVGLNPLRVLTLSRIVLAWSTRLSSPPFLPVPVAPPRFPLLPLPGQRDVFCSWQFYVAQQRPRKGPHFSSEGVSPRGNCAIATSAPWNLRFYHPLSFPRFRLPCVLVSSFPRQRRSFSRRAPARIQSTCVVGSFASPSEQTKCTGTLEPFLASLEYSETTLSIRLVTLWWQRSLLGYLVRVYWERSLGSLVVKNYVRVWDIRIY